MDKYIYISAVSAQSTMQRQEAIANNIANVNTPGFRSQIAAFQVAPVASKEGLSTRAYAVETTIGFDGQSGSLQQSDRPLDFAIDGKGWFAVQGAQGEEGYTRNGHFHINAQGILTTSEGFPVIGEDGEIAIPDGFQYEVQRNGVIVGFQPGVTPRDDQELGRLKLVSPEDADLTRSDDGLFRLKNGGVADLDEGVAVVNGFLEGSNVNSAKAIVEMISAQREFEAHLKMISMAEENAKSANGLLSSN